MTRRLAVVAAVVLAAAVWWSRAAVRVDEGEPVAPQAVAPARPTVAPRVAPVAGAPVEDGLVDDIVEEVEPDAPSRALVRGVAEVRDRCGLDAVPHCAGGRCVAVTRSPDLDRLGGWARLVLRSPTFVASTAARDLGIPPSLLPCGSAVGGLAAASEVASVELADGTEVWCTAPAAAGWDAATRALCAEAARERLELPASFDGDDLRLLVFDRER